MKKDLAKEIYDDGYVTGYNAAVSEFLEDLKSECLGGKYGGCLYTMDDIKCDSNCNNYKLYKKWNRRQTNH